MAWKYESVSYASTDHEFAKTVTATSGKKIKAGGFVITGVNTNTAITVRANYPVLVDGEGEGWTVEGYVPSPPSSWGVLVYVYEE